MMTLEQLPPIPRPPHDPTSWLLNWRVGWRAAELQHLSAERLAGARSGAGHAAFADENQAAALADSSRRVTSR